MLKAELVDTDKRALSEKKQISMPQDVKAPDSSVSQQDKQSFCPKFTVFSGEEPRQKNEASFEEWQYEVKCTQNEGIYPDHAIAQSIRRSLKDQAKKVLLPMGTTSSVQDILDRLESVFGNVAAGESVMQEFYTATQKQDETVTAWGLRLEEILQKAVSKGHVKQVCSRYRYITHFYCLAVEAGFYSDVVECLPLDPAAQVRFPPRACGIFLHPVTFGGQYVGSTACVSGITQ